jgi:thioredoxin-related protein
MKPIRILFILALGGFINWACVSKTYNPIVVRPASCSHDFLFAESPTLGHLLSFADKMHKPVFINFYAPWIESCSRMDQNVFTHDGLADYFNRHFINYKVNIDGAPPGPQLADMYGVTQYPTLLFLDGKGKIMYRHEGAATASQLFEIASYLHESVKEEALSLGTR